MYGVPADLPIQKFVGEVLFQVGIGMDGVHFAFGNSGTISVYGHWELYDASGNEIDCAKDHSERDCYRVHAIFNQDVINCSIDPPESFALTFANGYQLIIYDNNPQFESFAIMPDGIYI